MKKQIRSLSIACRIGINMHSLNNEGNQGNRTLPRIATIVTTEKIGEDSASSYQKHTVNAISGNSQKHGFLEYFRDFAIDFGLPLCEACQQLDSARMMGNSSFYNALLDQNNEQYWQTVTIGNKSKRQINEEVVTDTLLSCCVDDVAGILLTAPKVHLARKSVIEFGWCIGLPNETVPADYIYNRLGSSETIRAKDLDEIDDETRIKIIQQRQTNLGQMIFTRPSASGIYAFIACIDAAGIGYNDVSQTYPDSVFDTPINRDSRFRAMLLALSQYIMQPFGAQTTSQRPHITRIEGYLAISQSSASAPLVSPLNENYVSSAKRVARSLNEIYETEAISVLPFASGEELLTVISEILRTSSPGHYFRRQK